jgi:hypothetical protein
MSRTSTAAPTPSSTSQRESSSVEHAVGNASGGGPGVVVVDGNVVSDTGTVGVVPTGLVAIVVAVRVPGVVTTVVPLLGEFGAGNVAADSPPPMVGEFGAGNIEANPPPPSDGIDSTVPT